jgi:predicted tellurium resistance membrane protein TerC
MEWLLNPEVWIALVTLTSLEIVLGIDNIIFISILVERLPGRQRRRARQLGLALAMLMDASVVRTLLVPALMRLAGRANWWAPAPLRRLHARIGFSEA